jgi:type IV pilus assembly protein PilA
MRSFKRYAVRGFTLVELMIVVAIIGVLAALAIYGVTRYLASAKTSEAKNTVGDIARGAQNAFSKEQNAAEIVPDGNVGTQFSQDVCGTANFSVAGIPGGAKAQPDPATFKVTGVGNSRNVGWQCLNFEMHSPTYYRYGYFANRIGGLVAPEADGNSAVPGKLTTVLATPPKGFYAFAEGNLNNDATNSAMGVVGQINLANRTMKTGTQVLAVDEGE